MPTAPFLVVQLPNYLENSTEPSEGNWPRIREAQEKAAVAPHTGIITTIDLGDPYDIHPRNKKDVGYRLSLLARKLAYGEKELIHSGPTLKSVSYNDDKVILKFNNTGKSGVVSKDNNPLREFALAGENRIFHWGKTKIINGETIEITNENVDKPKAVRYAWQNNPNVNFYNSENLPVAPFRTDDWELK